MTNIFKRFLIIVGKPVYYIFFVLFVFPIFVIKNANNAYKYVLLKLKKRKKDRIKNIIKRKTKKEKKEKEKKKEKKYFRIAKIFSFKFQKLRLNLLFARLVKVLKLLFLHIKERKFRRRPYGKIKPIVFVVLVLLLCIGSFYFLILKELPSPYELGSRSPNVSTKIYDRNGNLLYKIYKDENRTIIPLNQIPENVRLATLAAEDAEFYSHPGFSIKGIFRALIKDIKTGQIHGGSTITQQLVKNTLLTPEKTLIRKIKELILSVEIEIIYSKDQILEMYLNEVSYGGTAYGIEEASLSYFGKSVKELNLAEASLLAGLPKSPTTYSPFGSNPDLAFERQREVLNLMVINRYISQEEYTESSEQKLHFAPNKTNIKAPHFVMYIRQILADKYGEATLEKGGLEITTSIDLSIQETAEKIVKDELERLKGMNVGNGSALVMNPQTGEILAMVGSKNYFDTEKDGNVNVLTRLRQPGSSIKVVNYAYALGNGYTLSSIINDSPITFHTPGTTPYSPVNYDGKFLGNVTLRSALAQSRNIPAVKILSSYGVGKMIEQGKKMGITTWNDPSNYGLSLTLGGGAVKALDLAKVYATLAASGKTPELMPILEIKNYKGQTLEENTPKSTQTLDSRISFLLTDVLKDNNARAPEFGYNSYLVIKNHPEVAVKTGTSNDLRDNWTVGYNQDYLVLTWVGNNDNSPMSRIASGVTGASPIWNKIMSSLLEGNISFDWEVPEGVSKINICSSTGTLSCEGCISKQEWFLNENKPSKHCVIVPSPIPTPSGGQILDSGASTVFNR